MTGSKVDTINVRNEFLEQLNSRIFNHNKSPHC